MDDIMEFLRESIRLNEEEARQFLKEERRNRIMRLSARNGVPRHFKERSLDNFDGTSNPRAQELAKDFVDKFPNTSGLLLIGDVGLGKTHLAAAIANELNKKLHSTYFGNAIDIVAYCKSTYDKESEITEAEAINIMTDKMDLMIIDDLGKEYSTENTMTIFYQIINRLYENDKPVVITTNFYSNELRDKLGDRGAAIVSRITSMCMPVILKGKDWRMNKNV